MKTKSHIITFPDGAQEIFKSQKQAFGYVIEKGILPRDRRYYNAHRKAELARLTFEGVLTYEEKYIDISDETRTNDEIKKYIASEVRKAVSTIPPKVIELHLNGKVIKSDKAQHYAFDKVLKCISAKCNVMLVGPAGSGKTTCVANAAHAIGLKFYAMSVGLQTSKVEFMGYNDANGKYVRTLFREAYEKGGVFLIDEIDAGNPGIMTIINAALANDVCAFPDDMIVKHKNFICCAAANTYGKGADRMYVGRNQLDAATLDRFVKLDFDYDENLENKLASNSDWCKLIQDIRKNVFDKKLRVLVTPRATIYGCALLEQKLNYWDALELVLFNGCSEEEKTIIINAASLRKEFLIERTIDNKPKKLKKGAIANPEIDEIVDAAQTK